MSEILDAPCVFCGYNGPRYWQSESHSSTCPWAHVAGESNRREVLRETISSIFKDARRAVETSEKCPKCRSSKITVDVTLRDRICDECGERFRVETSEQKKAWPKDSVCMADFDEDGGTKKEMQFDQTSENPLTGPMNHQRVRIITHKRTEFDVEVRTKGGWCRVNTYTSEDPSWALQQAKGCALMWSETFNFLEGCDGKGSAR